MGSQGGGKKKTASLSAPIFTSAPRASADGLILNLSELKADATKDLTTTSQIKLFTKGWGMYAALCPCPTPTLKLMILALHFKPWACQPSIARLGVRSCDVFCAFVVICCSVVVIFVGLSPPLVVCWSSRLRYGRPSRGALTKLCHCDPSPSPNNESRIHDPRH